MKLYIAAYNAAVFVTSLVMITNYFNDRLALNTQWILTYIGFFIFMFAMVVIVTRVAEFFQNARRNE